MKNTHIKLKNPTYEMGALVKLRSCVEDGVDPNSIIVFTMSSMLAFFSEVGQ